MATIANLHKSISEMLDEDIFTLIRNIRSLRREVPLKTVRKTVKKINKRQMTIEDHLKNVKDVRKEELIKKLLEIQKRRQDG